MFNASHMTNADWNIRIRAAKRAEARLAAIERQPLEKRDTVARFAKRRAQVDTDLASVRRQLRQAIADGQLARLATQLWPGDSNIALVFADQVQRYRTLVARESQLLSDRGIVSRWERKLRFTTGELRPVFDPDASQLPERVSATSVAPYVERLLEQATTTDDLGEQWAITQDALTLLEDLAFGSVMSRDEEAERYRSSDEASERRRAQSRRDAEDGTRDWLDTLPAEQADEWLAGREAGHHAWDAVLPPRMYEKDDASWHVGAGAPIMVEHRHVDTGWALIEDFSTADSDPAMVASQRPAGWTVLDAEDKPRRRTVVNRVALTWWLELREQSRDLARYIGVAGGEDSPLTPMLEARLADPRAQQAFDAIA
jgi:hypothetical protein